VLDTVRPSAPYVEPRHTSSEQYVPPHDPTHEHVGREPLTPSGSLAGKAQFP
jgi:hypothetical protein